ncbi:MAG: histidine kinase, partial [Anaerolineae bacterium]|nr:histidine kinase [Anaerolineae bacterium]
MIARRSSDGDRSSDGSILRKLSDWLHSLQAQLLLWAILPVTLVVIGLSLTGVYSHQRSMRDFVIQRDQLLARMLAQSLQDALSHGTVAPDGQGVSGWLPIAQEDLPDSVLVLDGAGNLLASSDAEVTENISSQPGIQEILSQLEGAVVVDEPAGDTIILTFSTVAGVGWRVIIRAQVAELIGPILRFSSLGPIAALAAVGLSLVILTFGWRTIALPLQQLSRIASEVSWGNHQMIAQKIAGVSEIQELHRALQGMVERLESYQTGLLDYLDAVTKGQEEERARLAREIHDGSVQSLIALTQRTEMAKHQLQRGELVDAETQLSQLRSAEVDVIEDLRRIIGALRPAYLEDLGFVPALEVLVHNADLRTEAEITLRVEGSERRLASDVELAAYRITQEAMNNAIQHAQAHHITVTVFYGDELVLQVADDGVGFAPATHPS